MHSLLSRSNVVAAFTLSVLTTLTFICFLSTVFIDYKASVSLNTGKISLKHVPDYSMERHKNDLGSLMFDLDADLSKLFNWNVKQLFLYLTAEYPSNKNALNQVVLWDKIIVRGENPVLKLKNMHTKYYFWDDGAGLKGNKNVTLKLSWNIIPNAGILSRIEGTGSHTFKFPDEYKI